MITHQLKRLPKSTVEISVGIPKKEITDSYEKAFGELLENLSVEGFRKGKVPKDVAQKHISKDSVYQRLIRTLFPRIYEDILKKEGLKPVMSPRIELIKAKEQEDWEIKISVAERPEVTLGDYKKIVQDAKKNQKKDTIWVPGKDKSPESQQDINRKNQATLNAVLDELLKKTKVEISDLILEEELNTRLSRLVDDVQKLGMTMDTYIQSKNTTMDELKRQYMVEIEGMHKLEFLLNEIAEKENIKVEDEELEKLFAGIQEEKEKENAKQNAYFYAALLRKQKTLDFLLGL